ncbi:hypothetical protein [Raoultibacter timonensis]|nr:hypothetical protein [Raoultibacter timonensis]
MIAEAADRGETPGREFSKAAATEMYYIIIWHRSIFLPKPTVSPSDRGTATVAVIRVFE